MPRLVLQIAGCGKANAGLSFRNVVSLTFKQDIAPFSCLHNVDIRRTEVEQFKRVSSEGNIH
jgi:hypothetical protein